MNPVQFFMGRVAPFRLKKKRAKETRPKDQTEAKEEFEERRRMAVYRMDQEAKRILNGPF